jgi:tyrosine-protein kinase Etk/Wzc
MFGRRRPRIIGEVAAPAEGDRPWSIARSDLETLERVRGGLGGARVVLVTGADHLLRVLAVGLAGAAAAAGTRTALLDCDLERSALAAELGLASGPGLHEYLRWEATPQDVLQAVALAGPASGGAAEPLAFVPAGRPASEPGTLLGLGSYRHMAAKLRSAYELVVLAGPPLDASSTALAAAATAADAVILALGVEAANRAGLRASRAALFPLATELRGVVVVLQRS